MNIEEESIECALPLEKTPEATKYSECQTAEQCVLLYIRDWNTVTDEPVANERIHVLSEQTGYSSIRIQDAVTKLKQMGEIYEPESGEWVPHE